MALVSDIELVPASIRSVSPHISSTEIVLRPEDMQNVSYACALSPPDAALMLSRVSSVRITCLLSLFRIGRAAGLQHVTTLQTPYLSEPQPQRGTPRFTSCIKLVTCPAEIPVSPEIPPDPPGGLPVPAILLARHLTPLLTSQLNHPAQCARYTCTQQNLSIETIVHHHPSQQATRRTDTILGELANCCRV